VAAYEFRGMVISEHMMEALQRYIQKRIRPGGFLTAVLANDLQAAVARADSDNLPNIPAFAAYLYNEVPSNCHGSYEIVASWLEQREAL
jgi:hypothetical protein